MNVKYISITSPDKDKNPKHVAKVRKCLKCNVEFKSNWIGNRLCKECTSKQDTAEI